MIGELHATWVTSYEVAFYKWFFVIFLIALILIIQGKVRENIATLKKKHIIPLSVFSIIFLYGNTAYAIALEHTKIMNIVMLMYLSVFLGILSGKVFFQEKIHANLILYAVVAFIGIILTLSTGEFTLHVWIWEILAMTIAFTITLSSAIVKYTPELDTWFRLLVPYSFGTALLLILIISNDRLEFLFMTPYALGIGILYAIATGFLGRGLKDLGTKYVPLSQVGIIMLLEPVLQISTAAIWGGQVPSFINLLWMVLVFVSIIWVSMRKLSRA